MKSIVTVNTNLPSVEDRIDYLSGMSLRDYDIALFDPALPYRDRVTFSGGGSCVDIEGTTELLSAMRHWSEEIQNAVAAGKTIFVLMPPLKLDQGAAGSTFAKGQRTYNLTQFDNYRAVPISLGIRNTSGKKIKVVDGNYRQLFAAIDGMVTYEVLISATGGKTVATTSDGAVVAAAYRLEKCPGAIVCLPYFNFERSDTSKTSKWTEKSARASEALVSQLVAIDRMLTRQGESTPEPPWVANHGAPKAVSDIAIRVAAINADIDRLTADREEQLSSQRHLRSFSRLLYENGKQLEVSIEQALTILGYSVENFLDGDREIDHIIISPTGTRMIAESEGKDAAAIDISKFRQLESNIAEDFERADATVPAKGILFGNGFRLLEPSDRAEQFTDKCITNAKRLGTALVRTADLYRAVVYSLDNPKDEAFKAACRAAIEGTAGEVVVFPLEQPAPKVAKS